VDVKILYRLFGLYHGLESAKQTRFIASKSFYYRREGKRIMKIVTDEIVGKRSKQEVVKFIREKLVIEIAPNIEYQS
jgi:hypothetical protein